MNKEVITAVLSSISLNKISKFFKEVRIELKKVVWPGRKDVVASTIVVIISVVMVGLLISFFDLIFAFLAKKVGF